MPPPQKLEMTQQARARARAGREAGVWQHETEEIVGAKYRLVRPIGRGGMAEVWLAIHEELKTELAVKFIDTTLNEDEERSQTALERFRFEAQISARLGARTRNVIAVYDAGVHNGTPYLAMEYVPGRTLLAEIEERGFVDPERLADVLEQIADALSVAHEMGIVHRDLKPSNLIVLDAPDGMMVKLADFGIAKALRADLGIDRPKETLAGALIGSPAYMSPEHLKDASRIDHRSDIWALGVVAYEALIGEPAFDGSSIAELIVGISTQPLEPPSKRRPKLPNALDPWFERALAKDPARRFQSVREQARAFRAALGPRARPPQAQGPAWYRRAIVAGMAGAAALAVLILVAWREAGAPQVARASSSIKRSWLLQTATSAPEPPSFTAPVSTAAPSQQASTKHPAQSAAPGSISAKPPARPKSSAPPSRRKEINQSEIL